MWQKEEIPDKDFIYRRIHKNELDEDDPTFIPPNNFHEIETGISTDWDKYSTAEESLQRAKNPELTCIIRIQAKKVRMLEQLIVEHIPILTNRAHSEIQGLNNHPKPKRVKLRLKLAEFSEWVINPFVN